MINISEVLICVVDDDHSVRKAVNRLLQSEKYPVETFDSAEAFLNRPAFAGPCGLILDVNMPGLSGFNLQQILSENRRAEQIIFISGNSSIPMCVQAMKAGAVDFLSKPFRNDELLEAVKRTLLRSATLLQQRQMAQFSQQLLKILTPREREVLSYVIAGKMNKQIADELGTTEKTIKVHRGHMMEKLKITSVAELVHFSLQAGLQPAHPYGTKVQ